MAKRIILDTDLGMGAPGSDIDDGFALALALTDPDIGLDLVTTVNGNTDVETATVLTLELLDRLERGEVPVYRGARRPLLRAPGEPGTVPDGVPRREPKPGVAAEIIADHVLAYPGQVTLVAIGPLTNVALALQLHPGVARALAGLMVMGGVFEAKPSRDGLPGEFNIWSDPEAAEIVLASGVVASWVGLDVTLQARLTRAQAQQMAADRHTFTSFAGEYTVAWIDHLTATGTAGDDSCPLHDPLAVAALTRPDLLGWRDAHLRVDRSEARRGAMVTSYETLRPNARIALSVDVDGFTEHLLGSLRRL